MVVDKRNANRLEAIKKITEVVGVPTGIGEYACDDNKFNFWVGDQEIYGTIYHGNLTIEWRKAVCEQKQLTLF